MADGLVAVDADRNVLAFNREAQQLTGLTHKKALGRPVEEVVRITNAKAELIRLPVYQLEAGSTSGAFIERRGQEAIPVAVTSAVLRGDAGEVAGGVAVLRDMTPRARDRTLEVGVPVEHLARTAYTFDADQGLRRDPRRAKT